MYKARFDKERTFGTEFEIYGINIFELEYAMRQWGIPAKIGLFEMPCNQYWHLSDDMSIQAEDGVEIRSPILAGVDGIAEVVRVLTLLNYLEAKTNESCGLHIHHNTKDFTGRNVLALLRLYSKFEPVIDGLVSLDRRGDSNIHCRSLVQDNSLVWIDNLDKKQTSIAIDIALKFDRNYKIKSVGGMTAVGSRHHKVNITSYLKHGTIEFRHFQGTIDIDDTVGWLLTTQMMVNKAKHNSVSRDMSASPTLSEFIRVLGMSDFQSVSDSYVLQAREWMKSKYGNMRRKKPVAIERTYQDARPQ